MHRLAGDQPFSARPVDGQQHLIRSGVSPQPYKNTGLGGGAPIKPCGGRSFLPEAMLEVRTSSAELGQGLVTVLQMIVA